ncbi:MAG TPA: lasso peptide biosynthesis B2 protein [Gemmatimonadaceae bacterium]|nr:lasso peptide biosynthesis B2 protein [Gemmatimonadaceae bacterium]
MAVLRATRRLLALPLSEVADLVIAQRMLLAALHSVRRRPRGQLLHPLAAAAATRGDDADRRWIERMATAVDRVARFGVFRPTCLVRAVALERLLQRRHAGPAAVRVGVHRERDRLFAHAWIELGGTVVGDDPAFVRRFVPLHDFSALPQ